MKVSPVALKLLTTITTSAKIMFCLLALFLIAHIVGAASEETPFHLSAKFVCLSIQVLAVLVFSSSIKKSLRRFEKGGTTYAIHRYYRKRLKSAVSYPLAITVLSAVFAKWAAPVLLLALYPALVHVYYALRFGLHSPQTIQTN